MHSERATRGSLPPCPRTNPLPPKVGSFPHTDLTPPFLSSKAPAWIAKYAAPTSTFCRGPRSQPFQNPTKSASVGTGPYCKRIASIPKKAPPILADFLNTKGKRVVPPCVQGVSRGPQTVTLGGHRPLLEEAKHELGGLLFRPTNS